MSEVKIVILGSERETQLIGYRLNRIEENYYVDPPASAYKYVLEIP